MCLLIGVCREYTSNLIINMLELKSVTLFLDLFFPLFLVITSLSSLMFFEFHFDLSIIFLSVSPYIDLSVFTLGITLYVCVCICIYVYTHI